MGAVWVSGEKYEPYVGRWSRLVAASFLEELPVLPGQRWLDVGCGTGALTTAVLASCEPAAVLGIDPSPAFVAWAADHVDDPRARFEVGDARELPQRVADVVVSGLVLNFVPDPAAAAAEMRAAAPSGVVAAYVWDYADRMDLMRYFWDAALALDPAAASLVEATRFPICQPEALDSLWRGAGLADVRTWSIEVPTVFRNFDDYWLPFLGGQGPAPSYAMSLTDEHRDSLRDLLRDWLPVAADGSISLIARAWAVQGRS